MKANKPCSGHLVDRGGYYHTVIYVLENGKRKPVTLPRMLFGAVWKLRPAKAGSVFSWFHIASPAPPHCTG